MGLIGQGIGFRDEGVGGGSLESWVYCGGGLLGGANGSVCKAHYGYIPAVRSVDFPGFYLFISCHCCFDE